MWFFVGPKFFVVGISWVLNFLTFNELQQITKGTYSWRILTESFMQIAFTMDFG